MPPRTETTPSTPERKGAAPESNGSFIRELTPGAGKTLLAAAFRETTEELLAPAAQDGASELPPLSPLGELLAEYRASGEPLVVGDLLGNTALRGLSDFDVTVNGHNDSTSNGEERKREGYVKPGSMRRTGLDIHGKPIVSADILNGFEIGPGKDAVVALVALDPSRIPLEYKEDDRARRLLAQEVKYHLERAIKENEVETYMSIELREILEATLIANDTFIEEYEQSEEGGSAKKWNKPYDYIASLKALYVLLTSEAEAEGSEFADNSGRARQGAVKLKKGEQEIIVGCSGLNSALDEVIAATTARDTREKNQELVDKRIAEIEDAIDLDRKLPKIELREEEKRDDWLFPGSTRHKAYVGDEIIGRIHLAPAEDDPTIVEVKWAFVYDRGVGKGTAMYLAAIKKVVGAGKSLRNDTKGSVGRGSVKVWEQLAKQGVATKKQEFELSEGLHKGYYIVEPIPTD